MNEQTLISHTSSKEDRDYLMEYQDIDVNALTRVELLGVPIDNVTIDEAVAKIYRMIEKKDSHHHILFLDPPRLMKVRAGKKFNRIALKSSLVLTEGSGIRWASGNQIKERISPIALMMDLIRLSEIKGYSIFLLGSKDGIVEKVFFNLNRHFPKTRIVGRHAGHLNRERELMVKEAIRKASPDIIFLAMDFPEQEVWIENNTNFFGKAVVIGVSGAFDTLSGVDKKAPDWFQLRGLTWLWRILARPYRVARALQALQFYILSQIRLWKKS